jgi:hypothetical protein
LIQIYANPSDFFEFHGGNAPRAFQKIWLLTMNRALAIGVARQITRFMAAGAATLKL